jgi:hypothetical protein
MRLGFVLAALVLAATAQGATAGYDAPAKEACKLAEGSTAGDACRFVWNTEADLGHRARAACDDASDATGGIAIDEPGVHRACLAAADLDGDGMLDLALAFEEGQFRFAGWTGDAACSGADAALKEHAIQGLDAPTFCEVWNQPLGLAKKGHDAAMAAIQNTR